MPLLTELRTGAIKRSRRKRLPLEQIKLSTIRSRAHERPFPNKAHSRGLNTEEHKFITCEGTSMVMYD